MSYCYYTYLFLASLKYFILQRFFVWIWVDYMWNLSPQTVFPIVSPQPLCWWYHCHLFELSILFIFLYNHYRHIVATVGTNLIGWCENTGILALHWIMYGYFLTIRTCKSNYDISRICTPKQHTGHTHTLHITYTID